MNGLRIDPDPDILAAINAINGQHAQYMKQWFPELVAGARQFVPGTATPLFRPPRAIVVGEAPGANEDITGEPFVGRSGRLLDELLEVAGMHRNDVYITNIVKYRPVQRDIRGRRQNRTPDHAEVGASIGFLRDEIAAVAQGCRLIIGLGRTACEPIAIPRLGAGGISMSKYHGEFIRLTGTWKLFVSYHPAWALRSHKGKQIMFADFKKLGAYLKAEDDAEREM